VRFLISAFVAVVVGLGACSLRAADESAPYIAVPMVALLAAPESHIDRPVQTGGFARNTARGLFLFLTEQDADHFTYLNAIALDVDRSTERGKDLAARMDGQYVYVTGTFVHLGDWVVGIRGVATAVVHEKDPR